MNFVFSVAALGLAVGGATAVATQSSCSTSETHVTQPAAAATCQSAPTPECLAPAVHGVHDDKVAARAAQLEALAGGAPAAAPHSHASAVAPGQPVGQAPADSGRRVFRYEGGRLVPLEPNSRALPAAPAAPAAPCAPVAPCEPCEPCEPVAPAPPHSAHAPAAPAPKAKLKAKGGVSVAPLPPQQRAEVERALAEAQREQQRAMARAHEEIARAQRDVQREVQRVERESRAEAARALELAQTEARRAGEQARAQARAVREFAQAEARATQDARRTAERRAQAEVERAAQSRSSTGHRSPSAATSPRERELEQRVAELEARLAELESRRAPAVPRANPPASRPGGVRATTQPGGQAWRATSQADGTFELQGAPQGATIRMRATTGADAECSPSRVRVFRTSPGQSTVVIEGSEGPDDVELSPEHVEWVVPGAGWSAWAEDLAEWGEEFAEDMAEWSEEFAEEFAERGAVFAEQLEAASGEGAGDCCTHLCEEACEEPCEEPNEEPCEAVGEGAIGLRAGQLGALLGTAEEAQPFVLGSLFAASPSTAGLSWPLVNTPTPAVQGLGVPTDGLRGAVSEMRAEVEDLRELLSELRREVEARKREELR